MGAPPYQPALGFIIPAFFCLLAACSGSSTPGDGGDEGDLSDHPEYADDPLEDDDVDIAEEDDFLPDADNDTISDAHEGDGDMDGDTIPDYLDLDSDADTIPDSVEAGDEDLETAPRDTDEDGYPDFRDRDSDGDGLADEIEYEAGGCTPENISSCCPNPYDPDSDDDGVSDLGEYHFGNPCSEDPWRPPDYVFTVPYWEEPDPPQDTLVFSTNIRRADVFFAVDTTASMEGKIESLTLDLSTYIIPQTLLTIDDVWFGIGGFEDHPAGDYGAEGDRPFYLEQRTTSSHSDLQAAAERLSTGDGGDLPGSHVSMLSAVAMGSGLSSYLEPQDACLDDETGYPCFRAGSMPIIVLMTDSPFHNGPLGAYPYDPEILGFTPPSYSEAVDALNAIRGKVIGISSGPGEVAEDLTALATDTGAVDVSANPLVYEIPASGEGLADQVVTAIRTLAENVPISVSITPEDDPSDFRCVSSRGDPVSCCPGPTPCSGDSTVPVDALELIDRIVANVEGGVEDPINPGVFCLGGLEVDDELNPERFLDVLPGAAVCFDIVPAMNMTVPAVAEPQVFKAVLKAYGDDTAIVDQRDIYFIVPALLPGP